MSDKIDIKTLNGHPLTDETARRAAENNAERIERLSEEIGNMGGVPGQTTPETFGAKGDGVTDDAAAITQALASGKNVVFDGTKTYAVGSVITIPADSIVDFRCATVKPLGNHDVIQVKPGSHIENLVVKCTDVPGWDASAMVFYGGDMFRASNLTRINNAKLYNDTSYNDGVQNLGNGVYMYADDFGQFIEGLAVDNLMTSGFNRGVYIKGIPDSEETGALTFIGGNNFQGYWSFRDTYGIYMDGRLPNNILTNNFFTDLNIQSDYYGGSVYAIYTTGDSNYFSGCLYDYSILDYHPVTAVFFDVGSTKNVVEVTAGYANHPNYCINLGDNANRVFKRCFSNGLLIPTSYEEYGMIGNQDDALAFIDKRAECTLESHGGEPFSGSLSSVFNPNASEELIYRTLSPYENDCRATITIKLKKVLRKMTNLVFQFGQRTVPKNIKVTVYSKTDAMIIYNTNANANRTIIISPAMQEFDPVPDNIAKIVVDIGGFNLIAPVPGGGEYGEWSLERILAVDGMTTGGTWIRRDGGEICGNLKFLGDTAPILTSPTGKRYKLSVSDDGVLTTAEIEDDDEIIDVAAITPVMAPGASWYNAELAGTEQSAITSVAFSNAYEPTGNEDAVWTCDADGYGDIVAYRNGTEVVIKSTTGSEGVQLNPDSTYMFANDGTKANFAALASITGTETCTAKDGTSIAYILRGNTVITNPISIPNGVVNMTHAFNGCNALTLPPVLPEGVVTLNNAFAECIAMQRLPELPSTVQNIEYAFHVCRTATVAPSTIPASVTKMQRAFRNCWLLNGTIEVNTANLSSITSYEKCFDNTSRDSGAIVLTGTSPYLAELAATNTQGKVTVAS